ncbi:MAG: single-stranded DNA-binding protein [Cyclobacteriaceae bacterium]
MKNSISLIGYIGADPDFKTSERGVKYCRFSIATSESYKNQEGEKIEKTEWHDCVAYNKTAELINEILHKGSLADIEGKLTYSTYEKDGNNIKRASIEVEKFLNLSPKPKD